MASVGLSWVVVGQKVGNVGVDLGEGVNGTGWESGVGVRVHGKWCSSVVQMCLLSCGYKNTVCLGVHVYRCDL